MEPRLQLRIQRYGWDAAAPHYHDSWRSQLEPAQTALLRLADIAPGQRVIETACGSGMVTLRLADMVGSEGYVLATDIAEQMVIDTRNRARTAGLDNVETLRMGAEALDVPDGSFDRAICSLGLMYSPEPEQAVREMARALRPGGRATVAVWGERKNCAWAEIFPIVDACVQSEVCPLFFSLGVPGAIGRVMAMSGFSNVTEERIRARLRFDSKEELLRAKIDGGAVALAAKRFTPETRQMVEQQFLDSVADFRDGSGYDIPGEFVVATGISES